MGLVVGAMRVIENRGDVAALALGGVTTFTELNRMMNTKNPKSIPSKAFLGIRFTVSIFYSLLPSCL
jgi:hypothetical protein